MPEAVWLVRHAETEWSRARRHTGRTDIPLTDAGREAARALRARIAACDWALVLTSPLGRARETAELIGAGPQAQAREDLLEWDYGEVEGITTADWRAQRDPDWWLWRDGAPGGESPDDVAARADRVVAELLAVPSGDALVVAHGHLLRVLAARWLEQPPQFGSRLRLETGAVCVLGWERDTRVLLGWNA